MVVIIIGLYCCYNFYGLNDDGKGPVDLDVETAAVTSPLPLHVAHEYRNEAFEPQAPSMASWRLQAAVVTLQRLSVEESYGFALNSNVDGRTAISKIQAGSPADGRLKLEDVLTSVNDTLVADMSPARVQAIISQQASETSVTLGLQTRVRVQDGPSQGGADLERPSSFYQPLDGSRPLGPEDYARIMQLETDATVSTDSTRI